LQRHRYTTEFGVSLLKQFEGFRSTTYVCPGGKATVGYGHAIKEGENFSDGITEEEGEELLKKDLFFAERAVSRLVRVPLTNGQFDSLVSFTYNLGPAALQRSALRMKLNRGESQDASKEFLKWCWAGGKKLRGLSKRRRAERELFLG